MNLSAWSIRNPIPAAMLFVLLTFAGLLSFRAMKVQNFPDMDLPVVMVTAALPGAAPGQLETDVARKIENAIATTQGLKHITTTIVDGTATIAAEYRLEKPVQEAVDDVRSAVSRVRADMPADLRDPIVTKLELSSQPILAFAIASDRMDDQALSWFVDDTLTRRLLAVPGVGAVGRVGGVQREVRVAIDPLRLQALGATAADVSRQLRLVQTESAGGRTDLGGAEQPVRTIATVRTAQEIAALDIPLSGGGHVRLDRIATVTDTVAEPRTGALLDGKPVIGFEVSRSRGASEVEVGAGVQRALDQLVAEHPDLHLTRTVDFVEIASDEYDSSMHLLYEGAILAVVVVWLFLRNWRATIVSAVALPLSVLPAFIGMYMLGFSINIITLLALSLVVGILVDDAIVEVENIVRHLRMGKTPYQAAMEAADEIGLAVIATTFTLIAVFLPTAFMSGIPGRFFKQFGWTAALAVFASLVVARLLTPMMAAYILKPLSGEEKEPRWLSGYMRASAWALRHRVLTVIGALLFFVASIALIPLLPSGFIPPDDNAQTQVNLELPPGTRLAETRAAVTQATERVQKVGHVRSIYTAIGGGSAGADPMAGGSSVGDPRKATLTLRFVARGERPRKQEIEQQLRLAMEDLPGVRVKIGLGGSNDKYVLALASEDPQALADTARAVERDLRTIPGVGNIGSSASLVRPEIVVRPDFARAADLGVTSSAIAETLRVATVGDYDQNLPKLNLPQRQVPIVVRLDDAAREDLSVLERLAVPGARGPVRLGEVARLEVGSGPAVINRYDRARNVNFEVELGTRGLGEVTEAVRQLPSVRQMPASVRLIDVGDAEMMGELFASFGLAMLTGVVCIYLVLVLLFKDFLQPVTILMALPLSLGGAFVGLLIAGKSFSMPSLIGLIMLMGIATKNSILLVEYAIVARRDQGMSRWDALLDACHKRARPIIMTTLAMGAGMLPIAMAWGGADMSFRSPMAVAVIGGLLTSTVLSLLVVPAVFTYVDDFAQWFQRRVLGRPGPQQRT
ncbi:efflux RND transporter permease subunit [Paracidovorax citrulli]|uniref:efflux RND transporter permease subunit n=1 Tax=Paracidovorax citrulli TaxID=80869 RepID=UPI0005FA9D0F|nr:efflux RND transporter permease subunit [Paracidovorax citrulli]QCX10557.1 Swarming motility protein SwrC [Paracidovorax citrulli]UEG46464.1 efflux RND transporter permease subunit [Paracidovorax citrulli]UMT90275.1 efflux RND transporter permease subunit [Paracidovorax citrulli]UMT94312.1 efflux RND transporter permease subunit [Paracidovorax citrulli]WIY34921.1 efflux RND transporter permease subunit [Paracidovorax citrulli]